MDIIRCLNNERIVPVAVIDKEEYAVPLAKALIDGGINIIEVTFRTEAARGTLERISALDGMTVGAGTILNIQQAEEAVKAGAEFLVSPAIIPEVIEYGQKNNIPVIPGCSTPSEMIEAKAMGLSLVKFFPAEYYGGAKAVKAFADIFPDLMIMPTGGINAENIKEYLSCKNVCACGGSFMVKKEWLAAGEYDKITQASKEAKQCLI